MATRKKSKSSGKGKERGQSRKAFPFQITFAGLILTIISIAALLLIRGPSVDTFDTQFLLEDLEVEVESALLRSGFSLNQIELRRESGLLTYEIRGTIPAGPVLDRLESRLKKRFAGIEGDRRPETGELLLYRNGALACMMNFERPEAPLKPPEVKTDRPRIAIIIDDLGRSITRAKDLVNLGIPVTFSILPGENYATDVALLAARSGYEIMIHLPMEPHSYPATDPGPDALLLGQSEKEMITRVHSYFRQVPYASGANNHMGSRFTEFEGGMHTVLKIMREKGMFFVDSRTTGQSVAVPTAQKLGVPTAVRDVFLDNVADVDAISEQIRKLVRLGQKKGSAVGICHPYPETIEALQQESDLLRNGPVEVVFASKLVSS